LYSRREQALARVVRHWQKLPDARTGAISRAPYLPHLDPR
jgi:hypothetical protein